MEAHFTMLQIENTPSWVAVRRLQHGSGYASCVMISDRGRVMERHTLMVPLETLQHGKNRRDMTTMSRRTLKGYFSEGKDYGNNQLCFMFSDGSADIVIQSCQVSRFRRDSPFLPPGVPFCPVLSRFQEKVRIPTLKSVF